MLSRIILVLPVLIAADGHRVSRHGNNRTLDEGFLNATSLATDGVDEYVYIDDEDALECDDEDEVTACAWVKAIRSRQNKAFMAKGAPATATWELETRLCTANTSCQVMFRGPVGWVGTNAQVMLEDTWYLLCVVYDGDGGASNFDKVQIYLNETNVADIDNGTIPSTLPDDTGVFTVAQWDSAGRYKDAIFNEVYMGCEALNSTQISTLYNDGEPIDPTTVFSDLRVWFRFESDNTTTITNYGSASNGIGVNLEEADFVSDVPGM